MLRLKSFSVAGKLSAALSNSVFFYRLGGFVLGRAVARPFFIKLSLNEVFYVA